MNHLLKTKKEFKKFKETNYIYKNKLDQAYFQHDIAYGDFKDFKKRNIANRVL